jgi:hypothetical protein
MGYFLAFMAGGFFGILGMALIVAGKNSDL